MDKLQRLILRALGAGNEELPQVPAPVQIVSGLGPVVDRGAERMPPDQKRKLQLMLEQKKVGLSPMPAEFAKAGKPANYQFGEYDGSLDRVHINPDTLLWPEETNTENLTHEVTHAMQPQGWLDHLLQRTRKPIPADYEPTGNPYLDHPREIEARLEAGQIRRRK